MKADRSMRLPVPVNASLAMFPGRRHIDALIAVKDLALAGELCQPALGAIGVERLQLVPQNLGTLTEATCDAMLTAYSTTEFRLHANVRVLPEHRFADLANLEAHWDWWQVAGRISRRLGARAYSAHAGRRENATLAQVLANAARAADLFECPVAIEGNYPTADDALLVSTWDEYRRLFESGTPFVVDLSHLNILARQSGVLDLALTRAMLASPRCLEVHLSDNDGRADTHAICGRTTWWHSLLDAIHPEAVVFSEGNHRKALAGRAPIEQRARYAHH
jgi:hypothetical protein